MPTVSVVIPTYNRAAFLKEAIESVLAQTYQAWELIVIDDGSTDTTRETVEAYVKRDPRVRYLYQSNQGLPKTRARSLEFVRGQYVAFLDGDDLFLPEKLACQVEFLDAHPDVGMVYSYVDFVDRRKRYRKTFPEQPAVTFEELLDRNTIQSHAVLVRKACFDRVGSFRGDLKKSDDYEMWLRIAKVFSIAFLPKRVALYRWHEANMSYDRTGRYQAVMTIYHGLLANGLSKSARRRVISRCAQLTYRRAVALLDGGDYGNAAKYFLTAVSYHPLVGLKIPWGRFTNPLYRSLRPYLALFYCTARQLATSSSAQRASHASR